MLKEVIKKIQTHGDCNSLQKKSLLTQEVLVELSMAF